MRLKKGSKVEVLSKIGAPSGSWRCAEIIGGNGHTYTVRYEGCESTIDLTTVERIPRKAIRPCPPLPEIVENWAPGDVVEVFDDFSWKMATISEVLGNNHFLVRILGSTLEFEVSKFGIRTRQSWQDGKWIIFGKASGSYAEVENSTLKCKQNSRNKVRKTSARLMGGSFAMRNKEKLQEVVPCRTLKRGSYGHEQVERYDGTAQKFRAVEKEGRLCQVLAANQSSFAEEVEDVAFPKEMVDEKYRPRFYNRTVFAEMHVESRKHCDIVGCSSPTRLEYNGEDSVTSSVGSCGMTSINYCKMHHPAGFIKDIDGDHSDAESFCHRASNKGNNSFPTDEILAAEVHRLELHAYRCTMEALFASGPLSWEQEELVTNLRLSLHISNDEHLMEVRHLVSSDNSIPSR